MSRKNLLEPRIKSFCEYRLEHYWDDKRELQQYKDDLIPSAVQSMSGMPGAHGGEHRPAEDVAIRMVQDSYIRNAELSIRGIDHALSSLDPDTVKLIDLVYWRRTHSVEGAALAVHMSTAAAYRRISGLLSSIALELGFIAI